MFFASEFEFIVACTFVPTCVDQQDNQYEHQLRQVFMAR